MKIQGCLFVTGSFLGAALGFVQIIPSTTRRNAFHRATTTEDTSATETCRAEGKISPDMEAYASGYQTVFEELPFKLCSPSVGKVPDDLVGSYFRSGPAMFSAGSIVPPKTSIVKPKQPPVPDGEDPDRMVKHPFDGDGAMLGVTFSEKGEVSARFRYIRTIPFTAERKKGTRTYKGMDSTREMSPSHVGSGLGNDLPLPLFRHHLLPGLNKLRKNTSNTRAIYWGKRLFSMWEGGHPFKLDGRALSTEGRSRFGGAIKRDSDPFGSKLSYDSKKNRALFYGVEHGTKSSEVTLYEFDEKFNLVDRSYSEMPGFSLITDFCTTDTYALFVQPDVAVNGIQFMIGKEPGKTLSMGPGLALLHLIPRAGSQGKQQSLQIPLDGPTEANLHFVNAYERGDEIIFDAILSDGSFISASKPLLWPWGRSLGEYQSVASKKSMYRYIANTRTGKVVKQQLFGDQCYFGVINQEQSSRYHRYIYMNVGSLGSEVAPPQGIARYDCESGASVEWIPERHEFCGEPMYAPRKGKSGEDDGYVLTILYNGKRKESELVILEANAISEGPIARLPLGIAVPHGLFGCFTQDEDARWEADALERRAKLADKIESRGNLWNEVKSDFSGLGLRFDDMEEYFGDFFNF
jgi:all-trans-8'-apo-beta-carotenal 15,15'-oxygenase